jgi:hypothetical protein
MDTFESLSHSVWECKYHVVFIPKCRRKTLYGQLRQHLGEVFRKLATQKESRIEEGHLLPDHGDVQPVRHIRVLRHRRRDQVYDRGVPATGDFDRPAPCVYNPRQHA